MKLCIFFSYAADFIDAAAVDQDFKMVDIEERDVYLLTLAIQIQVTNKKFPFGPTKTHDNLFSIFFSPSSLND